MLVNFKLDFDQNAQVLTLTKFALGTTEVDSSVSMRLSLV